MANTAATMRLALPHGHSQSPDFSFSSPFLLQCSSVGIKAKSPVCYAGSPAGPVGAGLNY